MSDLECAEGNYCHAPSRGSAHTRCHTCRRRRRRCHRDGMCCPGNHCSHGNVSTRCNLHKSEMAPTPLTPPPPGICVSDSPDPEGARPGWRRTGAAPRRCPAPSEACDMSPGQLGDACLSSAHCAPGLCCARHFWTHICKPVLREGQVCTRRRPGGPPAPELFQRCPCGDALTCRTLRGGVARSPAEVRSTAKASRHAPPHASLLMAVKTRLHVCQRA